MKFQQQTFYAQMDRLKGLVKETEQIQAKILRYKSKIKDEEQNLEEIHHQIMMLVISFSKDK